MGVSNIFERSEQNIKFRKNVTSRKGCRNTWQAKKVSNLVYLSDLLRPNGILEKINTRYADDSYEEIFFFMFVPFINFINIIDFI